LDSALPAQWWTPVAERASAGSAEIDHGMRAAAQDLRMTIGVEPMPSMQPEPIFGQVAGGGTISPDYDRGGLQAAASAWWYGTPN
jgi:hypothetical protein